GERWNAVSDSPVHQGQALRVTAVEGLTAEVAPEQSD
ncbi:MAG: NfeD family protein, partial [Pseudomonadota bacterium]|nr:NfeD family protein [Pseudomonadota bacterium]